MKVVATAPIPGVKIPSLPFGGAIFTGLRIHFPPSFDNVVKTKLCRANSGESARTSALGSVKIAFAVCVAGRTLQTGVPIAGNVFKQTLNYEGWRADFQTECRGDRDATRISYREEECVTRITTREAAHF
jgi:hypothetical protein